MHRLQRKWRMKRRGMWLINGCWTCPEINLGSGLNPEPNLVHDHKGILERTMCVITTNFKGIPDPTVISWGHWIMKAIQGHEDQEMTRGLGVVSNQEAKMMIPEWWTWWKWSVLSPHAWKASLRGLKVLTLVPNPVGISPQMHVTCGWRAVLMHDYTLCPCINTSYA